MPPHPVTNSEIQKYHQNKPRLSGVYSRGNLPKIKDRAYVINLDEYSDIGTHGVALYVRNNNVTYFDSFGVERIPTENKAFIDQSLSITTNLFRIQAYDSIMCGYFCIGFIDFMFAGRTLTEFTNLFSSNNFKKMIKMAECNNMYPNLSTIPSNNQQFRIDRINEIKDYFIAEIKERELMSKRLSKYIAFF